MNAMSTVYSRRAGHNGAMQTHPLADLAAEHERDSSRARLGTGSIYGIFACWTLFSVYVYSRYSQLGDARGYLTGQYEDAREARTWLLNQIATSIISLVRVDVLAHLVFSLFAASGVAYMAAQARVHGSHRWPLLALLLAPGFGVWASVVGRESLYIGLLGFFLGAIIGRFRQRGFLKGILALLCVGGMVFIRAPFGMAMALFYVMAWMLMRGPRVGLSTGVQLLLLVVLGGVVLAFAWPHVDFYIQDSVLPKARSYFTTESATTRTWIYIGATRELFSQLWWMLPLSIVGPTPGEVMARPVMFPFFLSGLVMLGLLLYGIGQMFRMPRGTPRKVAVLAWFPAIAITLVSYVPFGIYNPGSGIRYAASFLLLLVFPSMLRSALDAQAAEALAPPKPVGPWRGGRLVRPLNMDMQAETR
jgi:hypothetical protein